ncbi:hypothetical protein AN958_12186 [Leucoagaricus sp. SymC.cos]|nr:hypothetical protein AN958_12186 [Leucoagaricus sp. SymC.cos]
MLESRLPSRISNTNASLLHSIECLKHVEMGIDDEMESNTIGRLQEQELVLTLFQPNFLPPSEQQRILWWCYLANEWDDEIYDYDTATWRPVEACGGLRRPAETTFSIS